jgi:heterodisulfide reductase subunit A
LTTVHEDPVSGERIARNFDLVVLSVGMRPAKGIQSLLDPISVPCDDWGFVSGEAPLPPRIHVAGAAKFPTDIASARQQGINAAYRLLAELEQLPEIAEKRSVAVIGNGWEGRRVARNIQAAGYPTVLLDAKSISDDGHEAYEHVSEAQITAISKTDGRFIIKANSNGEEQNYRTDALIIANGVQYQPVTSETPVVSLSELEKTLVADWEQIPQRVVFWLDHSSPEHKTNCRRALESAVDLTASGRQVTVILEKVLVHGPGGQRLYDRARRQGVRILRASDATAVTVSRSKKGLRVGLKEASLAEMDLSILCDMVVASDRVLPAPQTRTINQLIDEPLDQQGFSQWTNVRHQPINSRKRGIFFVGSCHNENDAADLDSEITTLLSELACMDSSEEKTGESAEIDAGRCGRCLTCFRTCTHGAVQLTRRYQPQIQSEDCVGCGRCVAQCPARAIQTDDLASEKELASETVVFACRRSGDLAAKRALADGLVTPDKNISIVPVSCCNSRIGITELIDPLLKGANRVIVAACHTGNCRSVQSGGQAAKKIQHQAPAMGLAPDAIHWDTIAANEPHKLRQVLENESISSTKHKGVN